MKKPRGDVVTVVCGDTFQAADGDGFVFNPAPAASRFTGPVTDPAQDAGENIGFAVQHIRIGELSLRDQPNIARNVGVRGTGPLTVDDLVKVIRIRRIGWLHSSDARMALLLSGDLAATATPRRIAGSPGK